MGVGGVRVLLRGACRPPCRARCALGLAGGARYAAVFPLGHPTNKAPVRLFLSGHKEALLKSYCPSQEAP